MEVKGTAVKSIPEFVKKSFPHKYIEWLKALPEPSRVIMDGAIFTNNWYSIPWGLSEPMLTVGKICYDNNWKVAAWDMGRYSADIALNGVYKFFVQMGTPKFLIEKGSRVFVTYFQPSEMKVVKYEKSNLIVHIKQFDEINEIIEHNIAGWIERALEISGCINLKVEITQSLALGNNFTEFNITWGRNQN
jgi:hypothetical protein